MQKSGEPENQGTIYIVVIYFKVYTTNDMGFLFALQCYHVTSVSLKTGTWGQNWFLLQFRDDFAACKLLAIQLAVELPVVYTGDFKLSQRALEIAARIAGRQQKSPA